MDNESSDFISRFIEDPASRPDLVGDLIRSAGRITINIPGYGAARRIAGQLREGSFSDYYEFEKLLARALHPILAGLNLNIISDLMVNRLFNKRFPAYAHDINKVLASQKKLTMGALKGILLKMVADDGHYMVIKFYDLVLRGIDAGLTRSVKPVEFTIMQMKNGLDADEVKNRDHVEKSFREFRDRKGGEAASLLLERMKWDDDLHAIVSFLAEDAEILDHDENLPSEEPDEAALTEEGDLSDFTEEEPDREETADEDVSPGPADTSFEEDVIERYARLIKKDYLDAVDPQDMEKIRGIIQGIYVKNEKVYDRSKAKDVVRKVLAIWIADKSLDDGLRSILEDIAGEDEAGNDEVDEKNASDMDIFDESSPGSTSVNGEDSRRMMDEELLSEEITSDDGRVPGGEPDALPGNAPAEEPGGETVSPLTAQTASPDEDGAASGEMEALLDDIKDDGSIEDAEQSPGQATAASDEIGVSEGELEALLNDISGEGPGKKEDSPAVTDDGESDFEPVVQETSNEEAESFVVKDEILFEDRSLVKKPVVLPDGDLAAEDIPQKAMLKTGDESIRFSHEIDEFQHLYSDGIDVAEVEERLAMIQDFFDRLAAGEDSAVHFAVYHKQSFESFLGFIDEHEDLKKRLDIDAAIKYCKKNKIIHG